MIKHRYIELHFVSKLFPSIFSILTRMLKAKRRILSDCCYNLVLRQHIIFVDTRDNREMADWPSTLPLTRTISM